MTKPDSPNTKGDGVPPLALALFGLAALLLAGALMFWAYRSSRGGDDAVALQSLPPYDGGAAGATTESGGFGLTLDDIAREGDMAPDFELVNLDGETVRLSDYAGRPVILNFWATWCAPCRVEMPELQRAHDAFGDEGPVMLTINQEESAAQVGDFFNEIGLSLPALLDPKGKVGLAYGAFFLPTTVIVGPDGTVVAVHRGMISRDMLDQYLGKIAPAEGS